jgi:hypothetical protein
MKKILLLCLVLTVLLFGACYFHNTPIFPAPAGFHTADISPLFAGGEDYISGMANDGVTVVAVCYDGMIGYSPDSGISWTKIEPGNIAGNFAGGIRFNAVAWGQGYFLAVGDEGRAAWSTDGILWQAGVIGPMSPKNILCAAVGVMGGRTVFTAGGTDGRLAYAVNTPEGPWYMADQTPFAWEQDYGDTVYALAWGEVKGNGVFVAVGTTGRIAFLKDFSGKWYGGRTGTHETYRSVTFGNDRFIAAGDNGLIKYSFDPTGYTWHAVKDTDFGLRPFRGVAFDQVINHFVMYTDDTVVGFSEFGDSWNPSNFQVRFSGGSGTDPEKIGAITCTASRIVMGGNKGTVIYSN